MDAMPDGSTILGSPVVCLSILYQYHAPHKTAACGDRTHDRTYAHEAHAPPAELRRQLRFIMGGPYQIDF